MLVAIQIGAKREPDRCPFPSTGNGRCARRAPPVRRSEFPRLQVCGGGRRGCWWQFRSEQNGSQIDALFRQPVMGAAPVALRRFGGQNSRGFKFVEAVGEDVGGNSDRSKTGARSMPFSVNR